MSLDEVNFAKVYIGNHMERASWFAKVVNYKSVSSQFGPSFVYNIITKSGKKGVFFIKEEIPELQKDICFQFDGTVKAHRYNEYTKYHETQFNRIKVTKVLGKVLDSD